MSDWSKPKQYCVAVFPQTQLFLFFGTVGFLRIFLGGGFNFWGNH